MHRYAEQDTNVKTESCNSEFHALINSTQHTLILKRTRKDPAKIFLTAKIFST